MFFNVNLLDFALPEAQQEKFILSRIFLILEFLNRVSNGVAEMEGCCFQ